MKFTLTYDGELPPQSSGNSRVKEKWAIRKEISPQLDHLWHTHPALKRVMENRVIPRHQNFMMLVKYHLSTSSALPPNTVTDNEIDLCASIQVGKVNFRPLVRNSFALACSLNILFMRNEAVGRVYQGGDIDNRVKTLLDALSVPKPEQLYDETQPFLYCLLEDDALITGLSIDTRRLLDRPDKPENEVKLVIDVIVTVTDARGYNLPFLGD